MKARRLVTSTVRAQGVHQCEGGERHCVHGEWPRTRARHQHWRPEVRARLVANKRCCTSPSPIRLVLLSSSKISVYAPYGLAISASKWKNKLASSGKKPDMQFLLWELAALIKPGQEVVLVNNASSNTTPAPSAGSPRSPGSKQTARRPRARAPHQQRRPEVRTRLVPLNR